MENVGGYCLFGWVCKGFLVFVVSLGVLLLIWFFFLSFKKKKEGIQEKDFFLMFL